MSANSVTIDGKTYTQQQLADKHSLAQLIELYNKNAKKPVKAFRDKPTALKRTWAVLQEEVPAAKPAPAKKPETKGKDRAAKPKALSGKIKMLVASNPKRQNTLAYEKFKMLATMDGKTVDDFKALEGNCPDIDQHELGWPSTELRWCIKKGWCEVSSPKE
jgi:hypothetical protein